MGTDTDMACVDQIQTWSPNIPASQLLTPALENFDPSLIDNNFQESPWLQFQLYMDSDSPPTKAVNTNESPIDSSQSRKQGQPLSGQKKSFNGQFRGPSHSTSIITCFQDFCRFMKQAAEDHHILGAPKWFSYTPNAEQSSLYPHTRRMWLEKSLKELSQLKRAAVACWSPTSTILQGFMTFSMFPPSGTSTKPIGMGHIGAGFGSTQSSSLSTAGKEAAEWLHAADVWQGHHAAKSTTVEAFQLRCLVLLSKTINDIDRDDHYTSSQTLLADAISNGLHQDWKLFGITASVYERELRRKVWSAVSDLDIAACIERGVQSMASHLFTNIGQPKGYNHDDYSSGTELEPPDRPEDQLTDSSFAMIAHRIRPLRYKINEFVNTLQNHNPVDQCQIRHLRGQIFEEIDSIPNWADHTPEVSRRKQGPIYRSVLDLYLHELLILLHLPFVIPKGTTIYEFEDTEFQRFICIRLGADVQPLWLFYVASCYVELRSDDTKRPALKKQITDSIMALFSKMCLAQEQKSIGFAFSDTHFACYIMQIHQAYEAVQQIIGNARLPSTSKPGTKTPKNTRCRQRDTKREKRQQAIPPTIPQRVVKMVREQRKCKCQQASEHLSRSRCGTNVLGKGIHNICMQCGIEDLHAERQESSPDIDDKPEKTVLRSPTVNEEADGHEYNTREQKRDAELGNTGFTGATCHALIGIVYKRDAELRARDSANADGNVT
ncbi:fungal specific transcription factor domain-containing protein [Aspergillus affinis]|uniref:fungal specific transcription factor domain-containing protein n=1 Tax=Aspergillus affinis TaxID=1070780 RepID=UPI0022FE72E2|nr:uncharacterized protein KD926_002291 [Aspergillus affinis]KAI9043913.1 hypothetical protein KD926_002291 [Aspergillus affinis]